MQIDPRFELITAAQFFYAQGWMAGTAGNLSARNSSDIWITASGRGKGNLKVEDFIRVALDGTILEQASPELKPSAETAIHLALYDRFPTVRACYHVHSIEANLVSRFAEKELFLPPLEMLKGFGIWEEVPHYTIPIFENYLQVAEIAAEIGDRFSQCPQKIPALLIRDHGVTVWASSTESARNYIELIEFIFRYMIAARQINLQELK